MATPPEIDTVLPVSGPVTGGTEVFISGHGLSTASGVAFGAFSALQFIIDSDSMVIAVTPPGVSAGPVPITVLTPAGNSPPSPQAQFNYQAATTASGSGTGTGTSAGGGTSGGTGTTTGSGSGAGGSAGNGSGGTSGGSSSSGSSGSSAGSGSSGTGSASGAGSGSPSSGSPTGGTSSTGSGSAPTGSGATGGTGAGTGGAGSGASGTSSGTGSGAGSTPAPSGNYIPGGAMIVPDGKTGLGGTDGTGAGFGVGTLMAGGGGSAAPSNLPYYVDPSLTPQLVQSLIGIVQNAASPDALEAQNLILRRMALEGDVVGSRIPPLRNFSEFGCVINFLGTLKENAMREQALAGILGVAGPAQPQGWLSNTQPLAMVAIINDRPPVPAQATFPLSVLVRSDFVGPVQNALKILHSYGATVPLVSPPVITLPPGGTGTVPPSNILMFLGRMLMIAPTAALNNPAGDPIALIRPTGTTQDFALACNVLNVPSAPIPASEIAPTNVDAVQCSNTAQSVLQLTQTPFVWLTPVLAAAGYYPASPFPVPANSTVLTWAKLANTTGLVAGVTELGDELSLLYRQDQVNNSVFASMLTWTWNGTAFAP